MSVRVLEEEQTSGGEPSEKELRQYAEFLGIDLDMEPQLKWIAYEGLMRPVPMPWKACTENGVDVFYFNFETGQSIWDHPCDQEYRSKVEECRSAYSAALRNYNLTPPVAAATGATRESKSNIKVSIVAPRTSGVFRLMPSRSMNAILDDMWSCLITNDKQLVSEIQCKVEATCEVRSQLCDLPSLFLGFVDKVLEYAIVTQEEIDDAWLDAALDLRLTIKHAPTVDVHVKDVEREDLLETTQIDDQRMSSFDSDYRETMDFNSYDLLDRYHDVLHPSESPQVYDQLFTRTGVDARASITQSPSIGFDSYESGRDRPRAFWRPHEFQTLV